MNVLIIDENCNAVDLAKHLADSRQGDDQVFLATDSIDSEVWASEGLTFCRGFESAEQAKAYVDANSIDAVLNFNSLLGYSGFLEKLEALGVLCAGTDRAFANTEYNKRFFKKWMLDNNISTAKILAEDLVDGIEKKIEEFTYPLVIKPDVQSGPSTRVCFSSDDLRAYFTDVEAALGASMRAILYVIEEYIEPKDVISFEYYLVGGEAVIEVIPVFRSVMKGESNALGVTFAQSPYPEALSYEEQCYSLLSALHTETGHAVRGHLEAIIDNNGTLYFMENNARPPACMIWQHHIEKPWSLIEGMINSDATLLKTAFVAARDIINRAFVTPLFQSLESISIDLDEINSLEGVLFSPYSICMDNGKTVSSSSKMPSLISALSDDFEKSSALLEKALASIKQKYDFIWD